MSKRISGDESIGGESDSPGYSRRAAFAVAGLGATIAMTAVSDLPAQAAAGYGWPIQPMVFPDPNYGQQWGAPRDGAQVRHRGADAVTYAHVPIYAIADGVVVGGNWNWTGSGTYGFWLHVRQDDGMYAVYAHMQGPSSYAMNARVERGRRIGTVGNTGTSVLHLHYELRTTASTAWGSNDVDPVAFIQARLGGGPTPPVQTKEEDTMLIRNSARGDFFATPGVVKRSPNPSVFDVLQAGGMTIVTVVDANIDAVLLGIAGPGYTYSADLYVNPALKG